MPGLGWSQAILSIISGVVVALLSGYISRLRDDHRWLKEEVYRPLYNQVASDENSNLYRPDIQEFTDAWNEFDYYKRYRVDESLRNDLDELSHLIQKLNQLSVDDIDQDRVAETLPEEIVRRSGSKIGLKGMRADDEGKGGVIDLNKWLNMFGEIVYTAESPEDLHEKLLSLGEDESGGHVLNFRGWDEHVEGWEVDFYSAFHDDDSEMSDNLAEFISIRNEELPKVHQKIKRKLENRINSGIFHMAYYRWRY